MFIAWKERNQSMFSEERWAKDKLYQLWWSTLLDTVMGDGKGCFKAYKKAPKIAQSCFSYKFDGSWCVRKHPKLLSHVFLISLIAFGVFTIYISLEPMPINLHLLSLTPTCHHSHSRNQVTQKHLIHIIRIIKHLFSRVLYPLQ